MEQADTDVQLMTRLAAGDQSALRALLARHGERIYRYALRLTQDTGIAEETANDVALEVWRSAQRYRGEARVTTWLLGITRYKAFNAMRGNQRMSYAADAGEGLADESAETGLTSTATERARLQAVLRRALRGLSAEHRVVLELTFFHERTYAEIAAIVGCPTATVRTRMHYAKRALQRALQNDPGAALELIGRQ